MAGLESDLHVAEPDGSAWRAPSWLSADVERIRRGGLRAFVRAAWPLLEPSEPLVWDWHLDEICNHAEAWYRGRLQNLVVNVPPGMTKTTIMSIAAPAWVWTWNPGFRLITASYAPRLAVLAGRKTKALVQSRWYRERWGNLISARSRSDQDFETLAGGLRYCTTPGSSGTGRHGHGFQIDDPLKAADAQVKGDKWLSAKIDSVNAWMSDTVASRAVDKATYRIGVVMQRLHEHDPSYYMLRQFKAEHLCLPALFDPDARSVTSIGGDHRTERDEPLAKLRMGAAARDPKQFAAEARREWDRTAQKMGGWQSLVASSQLQQSPVPPGGAIFHRETFQEFDPRVVPFRSTFSVISVDPTFRDGAASDMVALEVWGTANGQFYCYHSDLKRRGFHESLRAIAELMQVFPATWILVEDKANGSAIVDTMRLAGLPNVVAVSPGVSKEARASAAAVYVDQGRAFFAQGAPWLAEKYAHLEKCPRSVWDGVDTTSQAILYLAAQGPNDFGAAMNTWGAEQGGDDQTAFARMFGVR